jgi:hypothetical protein
MFEFSFKILQVVGINIKPGLPEPQQQCLVQFIPYVGYNLKMSKMNFTGQVFRQV